MWGPRGWGASSSAGEINKPRGPQGEDGVLLHQLRRDGFEKNREGPESRETGHNCDGRSKDPGPQGANVDMAWGYMLILRPTSTSICEMDSRSLYTPLTSSQQNSVWDDLCIFREEAPALISFAKCWSTRKVKQQGLGGWGQKPSLQAGSRPPPAPGYLSWHNLRPIGSSFCNSFLINYWRKIRTLETLLPQCTTKKGVHLYSPLSSQLRAQSTSSCKRALPSALVHAKIGAEVMNWCVLSASPTY